MLTELSMYWITRLDSLSCAMQSFSVFFTVFFVITCIAMVIFLSFEPALKESAVRYYGEENISKDHDYVSCHKARTIIQLACLCVFMPLMVLTNIATVFIPTTKEYCAIKVVPAILNDAKTKQLTNELYDLGI